MKQRTLEFLDSDYETGDMEPFSTFTNFRNGIVLFNKKKTYKTEADPKFKTGRNTEDFLRKEADRHEYQIETAISRKRKLSSINILESGVYDGRPVYYKKSSSIGLRGVIQGAGILCSCSKCKGENVVKISIFEKHAGSLAKKPSENIYLEDAQLSLSDLVRYGGEKRFFKKDKGSVVKSRSGMRYCEPTSTPSDIAFRGSSRHPSGEQTGFSYGSVISSAWPAEETEQFTSRTTGSEKQDVFLHKLLFSPSGIKEGSKLSYTWEGKEYLCGYKKGDGICCNCCHQVVSPALFEVHAQCGEMQAPYTNICLEDGCCIYEFALILEHMERTGKERNYFKDRNGYGSCGKVKGTGDRPYKKERLMKTYAEDDAGGCILCRGRDYDPEGFSARTVIYCDQCDREYHVGCLRKRGVDLMEKPKGNWFCSNLCANMHERLQEYIKAGPQEVPAHASLSLTEKCQHLTLPSQADVRWQILHGQQSKDTTSNSYIAECMTIFNECFQPLIDPNTKSNLIPSMLNSERTDQDYGGMYLAVLTVNDVVVSAAVFRVFSQAIAELPLVATKAESQGKGYFQLLFSCIEEFLRSLHVETLVLPAADDVIEMWKNKFHFAPVPEAEFQQYKEDMPILEFQGTTMLGKSLNDEGPPL